MLTLKNMHREKRLPFTTFFQSARAAFIGIIAKTWTKDKILAVVQVGNQPYKGHTSNSVTEKHTQKKKTPIYDFFPVGESRLYW